MFLLLLGINAWTDFREGMVYDILSIALFAAALLEKGIAGFSVYFLGCLIFLFLIFLMDRSEEWLGRGDYLILLSIAIYAEDALPMVLLISSTAALAVMVLLRQRRMPLVPFLFLGMAANVMSG